MSYSSPHTRLLSIGTIRSLLVSLLPVVLLAPRAQAVSETRVINEVD